MDELHGFGNSSSVLISKLDDIAKRLQRNVDAFESEKKMKDELLKKARAAEELASVTSLAIQWVGNIIDGIDEYTGKKKAASLIGIRTSVANASKIISDTQDIRLSYNEAAETARLENQFGCGVRWTEGGAYIGIGAILMQTSVILNTQYLNVAFFDEILAMVSPENSKEASRHLGPLAQNMQLFMTEQKPEVFSAVEVAAKFRVTKSEERSKVRRII